MNEHDMRVVKTREAIRNAFFDLLEERGFEHVTVADITRRARIGKGTFYYHYADKYDLAGKLADAELGKYRGMVRAALPINGDSEAQDIGAIRNEAMALSREMSLLLSIRTGELDVRARFVSLLEGFYRELVEADPKLDVKDSKAVASLFAENALAQMELVAAEKNSIDLTVMRRNLTDFIACLRRFYSLP